MRIVQRFFLLAYVAISVMPLGAQETAGPADDLSLQGIDLCLPFGSRSTWSVLPHFVLEGIKYSYANERESGLDFDWASLIFEGNVDQRFFFRAEPDLVGVDTPRNLYEAWLAWELDPALKLTIGQMRIGLGSELATPIEDFPLTGYSFTSYLDGRYDLGLRADGELLEASLYYDAVAAAGSGFDLEGHLRENPQFSLRLVASPWRESATPFLSGFFAGGAIAYSPDWDDHILVATPLESTVFVTPDFEGDAARWIHLEAGWAGGPVRFGGEVIRGEVSSVPLPAGGELDMDQLTAWTAYASWVVTGQEITWKRGAWQHPLASVPAEEGWQDAVEVAARYSNADIDRSLFDAGYTSYDPSTQEVRTFSLDVNWYFTQRLRFAAGWVKTLADHELTTFGGTSRDSSFVLRAELAF
ncbi:MAG: porin [Planctomycetota bacterium]